jgi:hypothetical protein
VDIRAGSAIDGCPRSTPPLRTQLRNETLAVAGLISPCSFELPEGLAQRFEAASAEGRRMSGVLRLTTRPALMARIGHRRPPAG